MKKLVELVKTVMDIIFGIIIFPFFLTVYVFALWDRKRAEIKTGQRR